MTTSCRAVCSARLDAPGRPIPDPIGELGGLTR